eukprot:1142642-Pelagomonas_calceolata.AAC.4
MAPASRTSKRGSAVSLSLQQTQLRLTTWIHHLDTALDTQPGTAPGYTCSTTRTPPTNHLNTTSSGTAWTAINTPVPRQLDIRSFYHVAGLRNLLLPTLGPVLLRHTKQAVGSTCARLQAQLQQDGGQLQPPWQSATEVQASTTHLFLSVVPFSLLNPCVARTAAAGHNTHTSARAQMHQRNAVM